MAYARVVNLEYKSAEDVEIYFKKWEKWAPDNMPEAISRTNVEQPQGPEISPQRLVTYFTIAATYLLYLFQTNVAAF